MTKEEQIAELQAQIDELVAEREALKADPTPSDDE